MNITKEKKVGEIVAEDFRTAEVFKSHGIDFCCGDGEKAMQTVCNEHRVDFEALSEALCKACGPSNPPPIDYLSFSLKELIDHILEEHHKYINEKAPIIQGYLDKIRNVHAENHPELTELAQVFQETANELSEHMQKEEMVLFPYIERMLLVQQGQEEAVSPPFGTIQNPIQVMRQEHDTAGEQLRKFSSLTNDYTTPPDACNSYQVAFKMLKEFDEKLHTHVHLENNILFPKTVVLEQEVMR